MLVRDPDGTWHLNPERAWAAREAAQAVPTVASVLGVPWQDVGSCARCRAYCHRYGDGGQPLCGICRRDGFSPVRRGRSKVRGILAGEIDSADLLTEQDFDDARRARVEAVERRYGPAR